MNIQKLLSDPDRNWQKMDAAPSPSIDALLSNAPIDLPQAYLDLLIFTNGGEGDLGVEPGWFQLWSADDVINRNMDYEIQLNLPGCFAFGSNGAGEMLVLRERGNNESEVLMIPFITMQLEEAVLVAPNIEDFIKQIGMEYGS